ncbi:MAG TPA: T9SS type A sorting domain-containing protein [Bacteroidia bacterium]|nr:T9SS type A sorting domain-containing protein [Bacteroidia bacterium]HNU34012.1 T9SS type A sorting domain-containing protein [Bacteroidia bacterium]
MLTSSFKKLTGGKFFFLIVAVCFSFISILNAQEIEWQNTIGGNDVDWLYSIQQTADRGYILGGNSLSSISGDKTENSNGNFDYWIIKIDSAGNIEWENTIGGGNADMLYSVQQTLDKGYILGGHSGSDISGDKTENSNGSHDYWIVKTDSVGNIQWQNSIGGNDADMLYSVQQTADRGYILGGYSFSNISGDKTENNNGSTDYWIVKTDSGGNIQWQNSIGGNDNEMLFSVQQTSDGGYILGGFSESNISGDKTESNWDSSQATPDYWIIKTDASGNILWQNTIGGSGGDLLNSVQQTTDGGYILGGTSASNISGDKTENSYGSDDYWIIKTDSSGAIQWQNTIGGNDADWLTSIQQTVDSGYILGGYSNSDISGDKTENSNGGLDWWIIKTDSSGNIQWQNTIGGNSSDAVEPIQQTTDGGYILGGYSNSDISGDKTENSNGNNDYWIVKLTDKYNSISGNVFADLNSNNNQDIGEPPLTNKTITEQNTGNFAFTQQNGLYSVLILDSGSFYVSLAPINYYTAVPVSHSATFTGINQTDSLNDFAFQPIGSFNDLCVTITPLSPFRAGFNASYMINYENVGTTALSGDVIFFPFNNVTYLSSNVTPLSVTTDSIVWSTGLLSPFQTGSIIVTVNVNAGTPIGSLINSSVRIEPVAGDANPGCNYHAWEVFVTGSLDPNDILVSEDTLTTTQLATQPFLDYTIRFQNTGNDTAFTVKIINPIDTNKLELSSIEFVNSSHPVQLKWVNYNRNMEFLFENILLPDSGVNEPQSHGFVKYRIKPKTSLLDGDSVTNKAYIYFDFNAPVETNTAVTKIVLPTSINELAKDNWQLTLFPNPAKDEITIGNLQKAIGSDVKVYDVFGKLILRKQITSANCQLSVADFPSSIYFIELKSGTDVCRAKFVKE